MNTEKFWLQHALHSFNLDTPNWYSWRTHDDNGNKIPNDERMCLEHVIVIKEGAVKPTKKQLEDRIKELKDKYELKQYQKDRLSAYPSIADQLDMLYWDKVNGTDNWLKSIESVKSKYPK
jgi:hypothetical protein